MIKTSTRAINTLLFLAACLLPAMMATAAGPTELSDKQYQVINPPQPTMSGDKIEVIEFFYYGCPYCNEALPLITKWLPTLPPDVLYRRVPVVRPDKWAPLARTYYTLEKLDKLSLHKHMFDSMHVDGLSLSDEKEMADWAQRNYIDKAKFMEIYHSPEIEVKVKAAQAMTEAYGITRIPAFVVEGKYLTTSSLAGSLETMLPTVDKIIVKARAERAKK